jgi:hypothetical protein
MHTGALMAVRQFLGAYLVYAQPWQRALIGVAVMAGAAALIAAGILTGNACVQIIRARRRRRGPDNRFSERARDSAATEK